MSSNVSKIDLSVGDNVSHKKYGMGIIRVLKPHEKCFVEFYDKVLDKKNFNWLKVSEITK